MALVDGRWWAVLDYVDKQGPRPNGGVYTKRYELDVADYAAAETAVAALVAAWSNVSNCTILKYFVYQEVYEDAYVVTSADGERENEAILRWQVENPLKRPTTTIPGVIDSIMLALSGDNNNVLDLADAAVTAWEGLYTAGTVLVSDGETVTDLLSGQRRHVKSKRG